MEILPKKICLGDQYSWKTGLPGPFYVRYSVVFKYKQIDLTSVLYSITWDNMNARAANVKEVESVWFLALWVDGCSILNAFGS